jgi:hypothetical protein
VLTYTPGHQASFANLFTTVSYIEDKFQWYLAKRESYDSNMIQDAIHSTIKASKYSIISEIGL